MTASVGRCRYCRRFMFPAGSPQVRADIDCMATRDHLVPRSIGPIKIMDQPRNLSPACHGCNQIKGGAPHEVFAWWMRQPQVVEHTPAQRRQEFKRFCYALMLAGFKAATRKVLDGRPKRSGIVAAAFAKIPPDDEPLWMRGKVRDARGRLRSHMSAVLTPATKVAWDGFDHVDEGVRAEVQRIAGRRVWDAARHVFMDPVPVQFQVFVPAPQTDEEAARDERIISGQEDFDEMVARDEAEFIKPRTP